MTDPERARAAIEEATRGFIAAFDAQDLAALMAYYAEDLIKLRDGAAAESRTDVEARVAEAFRQYETRLDVRTDEIDVRGGTAHTRGSYRVTLVPRAGGAKIVRSRRFLEVWREHAGAWQVFRSMDNRGPEDVGGERAAGAQPPGANA